MSRALWLAVGWGSQAAFALLCLSLMWFLQFDTWLRPVGATHGALAAGLIDALLIIGFAVPHSILLMPPVRRAMARRVPAQLQGAVFCWTGCLTLWAMMLLWQPIAGVAWRLDGAALTALVAVAGLGWLALGHSMQLAGFGWQTGLTPFLAWRRGQPDPPRPFRKVSLHRWMRHPIYLSFLVVSWLVPVMTWDRLLLAIGFSAYCWLGSWAKDRRLSRLVGHPYRTYMAEVPGFPLIGFGPLGRVPLAAAA